MHMADALLAPAVAATMYVASGTGAGFSINKLRRDDEPQKLPVMAVTSALVFAGQMINYTICQIAGQTDYGSADRPCNIGTECSTEGISPQWQF